MKRAPGWFVATTLVTTALACDDGDGRMHARDPVGAGDAAAMMADGSAGDGATNEQDGSVPTEPGASGCKPLVHEAGVQFGGLRSDKYSWYDGDCQLRTTGLVQSDVEGGGGFARGFTYQALGRTRTALGTNVDGWNGFGYLVNHGDPTVTSRGLGGSHRVVLAGAHHAIHELKMRMELAGPVDVTVHWFFATGRSHPIFAITHDSTPAGAPGVVSSDTRSPYGDIEWDEGPDGDGNIDGVSWGDKYRFVSTGPGPLTLASAWDYTAPNTIPYAMLWADKADAEMGLVQTQTFEQHPAGGDYGGGILAADCWGRTSSTKGSGCSPTTYTMPYDWLWPVQLNQYELPRTTSSHRVAWGSTYGSVGEAEYQAFGSTQSGYPYQSYSVVVVLGTHSDKSVETQRKELEVVHASSLTATRGTVALRGPAGVARSDEATYGPAGFNHVYGMWELIAADNAVSAQLAIGSGELAHPVLRVHELAGLPTRVRVNGAQLEADEDYFATYDANARLLWLTLNQTLAGTAQIEID